MKKKEVLLDFSGAPTHRMVDSRKAGQIGAAGKVLVEKLHHAHLEELHDHWLGNAILQRQLRHFVNVHDDEFTLLGGER